MKKVIIVCLAAFFLLILLSPASVFAEEPLKRMGWSMLVTQEQNYVYQQMEIGVSQLAEEIELKANKKITEQDLVVVSREFCRDYPEYFWFLGDYEFECTDQGIVTKLMPKYTLNGKEIKAGQEIEEAKAALKSKADAILEEMQDIGVLVPHFLHDAVAAAVTYDKSGNDRTVYDALVEGIADSSGYARAYQYLMNRVGVSCSKIDGTAVDSQGQKVEHSWNLVFLDSGCFYTDVSWDDQGEIPYHTYFNKSLKEISEDHTPAEYQLPYLSVYDCDHESWGYDRIYRDYYTLLGPKCVGGGVLEIGMTGEDLARCFELPAPGSQGSISLVCKVWYEGENFESWLDANGRLLAQTLGFADGYRCEYANLGKEYQLTVAGELARKGITEPTDALGTQSRTKDASFVFSIVTMVGEVAVIVVAVYLIISGRMKKQ